METWGLGGQVVHDFTLYSGNLGTALLLYKSYQVTSNDNDLFLCLEIVKACDSASINSGYSLFHTHAWNASEGIVTRAL